jgi:uncharacterized protein (DUF305 family)
MRKSCVALCATGVLVTGLAAGCGAASPPVTPAASPTAVQSTATPERVARPELVRQPYSPDDVAFMAGMIPHHAQALIMTGWAPSHGASQALQLMCERMRISQTDEIKFMRTWLLDRGQFVPAADATHMKMERDGMTHEMLMPGMLNEAEMAALDKARGREFDRLFLQGMIKHHGGAITMVEDLYKAYGAMQDDFVYLFVSDVFADQSVEIERMQEMLAALGGGTK